MEKVFNCMERGTPWTSQNLVWRSTAYIGLFGMVGCWCICIILPKWPRGLLNWRVTPEPAELTSRLSRYARLLYTHLSQLRLLDAAFDKVYPSLEAFPSAQCKSLLLSILTQSLHRYWWISISEMASILAAINERGVSTVSMTSTAFSLFLWI